MASWQGQPPLPGPSPNLPNGLPTMPPSDREDRRSMIILPGLNSVISPITPTAARSRPRYGAAFPDSQPRSFARQQAYDQVACVIDEEESRKWNAFYNEHWAQQYGARVDQLTKDIRTHEQTVKSLTESKERLESQAANCKASLCTAVQEATKKHQEQRKQLTDKAADEIQPLCTALEARKQTEERLEAEKRTLKARIETLERKKADVEKKFQDDLNAKQAQLDQEVDRRLVKEQQLEAANTDISTLTAKLKTEKSEHERHQKVAEVAAVARDAAVAERNKANKDLGTERAFVNRGAKDIDNLRNDLLEREAYLAKACSQHKSDIAVVKERVARAEEAWKQGQEQVKNLHHRQEELQRQLDASSENIATLKEKLNKKDEIISQYIHWASSALGQLSTASAKLELTSTTTDDDTHDGATLSSPSTNELAQGRTPSTFAGARINHACSIVAHQDLTPPKTPAPHRLDRASSPPPPPPRPSLSNPPQEPHINFPINPKKIANAIPQRSIPKGQLPTAHKKVGTEIKSALSPKQTIPQKRTSISSNESSNRKRRGVVYPSNSGARK